MTEKLRANQFYCPHCAAKYTLVKVEAVSAVDAKARCINAADRSMAGKTLSFSNVFLSNVRATISSMRGKGGKFR